MHNAGTRKGTKRSNHGTNPNQSLQNTDPVSTKSSTNASWEKVSRHGISKPRTARRSRTEKKIGNVSRHEGLAGITSDGKSVRAHQAIESQFPGRAMGYMDIAEQVIPTIDVDGLKNTPNDEGDMEFLFPATSICSTTVAGPAATKSVAAVQGHGSGGAQRSGAGTLMRHELGADLVAPANGTTMDTSVLDENYLKDAIRNILRDSCPDPNGAVHCNVNMGRGLVGPRQVRNNKDQFLSDMHIDRYHKTGQLNRENDDVEAINADNQVSAEVIEKYLDDITSDLPDGLCVQKQSAESIMDRKDVARARRTEGRSDPRSLLSFHKGTNCGRGNEPTTPLSANNNNEVFVDSFKTLGRGTTVQVTHTTSSPLLGHPEAAEGNPRVVEGSLHEGPFGKSILNGHRLDALFESGYNGALSPLRNADGNKQSDCDSGTPSNIFADPTNSEQARNTNIGTRNVVLESLLSRLERALRDDDLIGDFLFPQGTRAT